MKGNLLCSSLMCSRVSPGFERGSPSMKSIFIESFPVLSSSPRYERSQDDEKRDPMFQSAFMILSRLLRCIASRVASLRLWIPRERRLTQSSTSQRMYSVVISSGLHSNDISVSSLSRKQSRISRTSSSASTDGVPPPK